MAIADATPSGRSSPDGLAYDLKTKLEEVIAELNRITLLVPSLSAGELAVLDGVVAGTVTAGKAVVAGTAKVLDELDITLLKIGGANRTAALATAPAAVAAGYKVARGQHTTVDENDTVVTGLATVVAVVASLDDDPVAGAQFVTASLGDQAGAPAAGSVLIKTWKATASGDTALIAASTFGKKVNWVAIGT